MRRFFNGSGLANRHFDDIVGESKIRHRKDKMFNPVSMKNGFHSWCYLNCVVQWSCKLRKSELEKRVLNQNAYIFRFSELSLPKLLSDKISNPRTAECSY